MNNTIPDERKHKFSCPDGELDEVFLENASVHIERMDETAFWMGIEAEGYPRLMLNTGVHRGTWYFNIEVDSLENSQFIQVRRPRKGPELPRRKAHDIERIATLEAELREANSCIEKVCTALGGDKDVPPWVRVISLVKQADEAKQECERLSAPVSDSELNHAQLTWLFGAQNRTAMDALLASRKAASKEPPVPRQPPQRPLRRKARGD